MAITKCRQCRQDVSTEAQTCPHCGTASPGKAPVARWIKVVVFLLIVVAPIVFFALTGRR